MEREEFKKIWVPLSRNFYKVAFNILGSEQEAKDALQELYLKLWNLRSSLPEIESPIAYGTKQVKNIALDRSRSSGFKAMKEGGQNIEELFQRNAPLQSSPEREVINREMVHRLKKVVENMPSPQREVVKMRLFNELDYKEIATKTNLSQINARVLVSRGKKLIAKAMKIYIG